MKLGQIFAHTPHFSCLFPILYVIATVGRLPEDFPFRIVRIVCVRNAPDRALQPRADGDHQLTLTPPHTKKQPEKPPNKASSPFENITTQLLANHHVIPILEEKAEAQRKSLEKVIKDHKAPFKFCFRFRFRETTETQEKIRSQRSDHQIRSGGIEILARNSQPSWTRYIVKCPQW